MKLTGTRTTPIRAVANDSTANCQQLCESSASRSPLPSPSAARAAAVRDTAASSSANVSRVWPLTMASLPGTRAAVRCSISLMPCRRASPASPPPISSATMPHLLQLPRQPCTLPQHLVRGESHTAGTPEPHRARAPDPTSRGRPPGTSRTGCRPAPASRLLGLPGLATQCASCPPPAAHPAGNSPPRPFRSFVTAVHTVKDMMGAQRLLNRAAEVAAGIKTRRRPLRIPDLPGPAQ